MTKTLITMLALLTLALPALACAQDRHVPPAGSHAPPRPAPRPRLAGAVAHAPPTGAHAATARASASPLTTPRARRATAIEGQVNLNTATADELMRIPGIGPVRAQAILATRARQPNGRFFRLEDVMRVPGIGRGTLRRLRDVFVLTGPTTLRVVAASPSESPGPRVRSDDDV